MLTIYTVRSENPTGPPLVLLHAFPLSSAMWTASLDLLQHEAPSHDYVTVEFPGFGESPSIPNWTMEVFAEELKKTLEGKGYRKCILAGISMGGYAAFSFYRIYPDFVAGLVLSNTKAAADNEEAKKGREEFARDVELRGSMAAEERMLPKFIVPTVLADDPDLEGKLKKWILEAKPEAIASALRAMAARPDSSSILSKIAVPTLVLAGANDAFFSVPDTKSWADEISGSSMNVIEVAGHLSPIDRPYEWAGLVASFLRDRSERI